MFDIGLGEIVVLAALALLVFGPDQLPKVAAQAGRFVRDLRAMAASARKELSDSADLEGMSADLKSLSDLHPKRLAKSLLEDPEDTPAPKASGASGRSSTGPAAPEAGPAAAAPGSAAPATGPSARSAGTFDPDAT